MEAITPRPTNTYARLCREQRAAYFAWQNEPIGQDTARNAYLTASKALDDFLGPVAQS